MPKDDITTHYVIGDVHGHADRLDALLERIYCEAGTEDLRSAGVELIFVGDLIDKGPEPATVLCRVRRLVEVGQARMVIGNHELNWLIDCHGGEGNTGAFLEATCQRSERDDLVYGFAGNHRKLQDYWQWLGQQPILIDEPHLRVVHACWHPPSVDDLERERITTADEVARTAYQQAYSRAHIAMDRLIAGCQHRRKARPCPGEFATRRERVHWWPTGDRSPATVDLQPVAPEDGVVYPAGVPPVFFGHYALSGAPAPLASNQLCLDYGVAYGGPLVAYRHDKGAALSTDRLLLS